MDTHKAINTRTCAELKKVCTSINQYANAIHANETDKTEEVELRVAELIHELQTCAVNHRANVEAFIGPVSVEEPEPEPVEGED